MNEKIRAPIARAVLLALLALGTVTSAGAAVAAGRAESPLRCELAAAATPLPRTYPAGVQVPALPEDASHRDGSNDWSAGYQMQSMVYHLMETQDAAWAGRIIDSAERLLAARDARSPVDGRPYAWLDRSANLSGSYAWLGYAAHNFAPLMQFARVVVADPRLSSCAYRGTPLKQYARRYLAEFDRVLKAHETELRRTQGYSYYVFDRPVPTRTADLSAQTLPFNMNADVFLAMLHSVPVQAALGAREAAQARHRLVAEHVNYLTRTVLQRVNCPVERTCLRWRYATYMARADDVGHANVVAKFLLDAYDDGHAVQRQDLVALANTIDNLMDARGRFTGNLLDGGSAQGVSEEIYYLILYARFSRTLRQKLQPVVAASRDFAYAGAWLRAQAGAGG